MADIKNSFLGENEEWKLNLKYNKVICIIRNEREIYIRHPDKSYFDKKILNKYHIANVQKEINNNGKAIAYFVEFQLSDAVKFISIDQILKGDDLKSKLDLTFMLLQQNAKNIFLNIFNSAKYIKWSKLHIMCAVMQTIPENRML